MKASEIKSYRDILHFEYNKRREEASSYTLKKFSEDCGLPGNRMTDILNKRYGISRKRGLEIVERLKLTGYYLELFMLSVDAEHSRNMSSKKAARDKLRKLLFRPDRVFTMAEFGKIFDWHKFALVELMRHPRFKNNLSWLAQKMRRSVGDIQETLEDLVDLGSVSSFQGIYKVNADFLSTQNDIPSQAIRDYHKQVLDIAKESLDKIPVTQRDFSSINFLCDPKDLPEIKEKIRTFRQDLVSEFEKSKEESELFVLNVQMFSPTQNSEQH